VKEGGGGEGERERERALGLCVFITAVTITKLFAWGGEVRLQPWTTGLIKNVHPQKKKYQHLRRLCGAGRLAQHGVGGAA
jgi:hypothetical protein